VFARGFCLIAHAKPARNSRTKAAARVGAIGVPSIEKLGEDGKMLRAH
jgi:hypothetical protein